ncbi:MAG: glycoside hydrolase family 18 protein [Bacteroidetes bacterium]|nr:glycoside hydrolase family 18 protein [Bacteroidota bacterium]
MKTGKYIFLLLPTLLYLSACKKETLPAPPAPVNIYPPVKPGFMVVGYFPSYRYVNEYPDRMFRMCDVVNYAFANITAAGTSIISDIPKFDSVYQKAKANGAMVFLSIAGDPTLFASMSSTSGGRNIFIQDIMQKVRQNHLDGIDIDWEYPHSNDGTGQTFSLLMKQLSDSLHVDGKYFLTAAITPGKYAGSIRDGIGNDVFQYADWFNVMAYDDFSTNPANLYQQHSPFSLATTSFDYWINTRGMPKDKCLLGIPIYGRPSGMTQTGTVLTYKTILQQGGSPMSDSAIVSAGGFSNYTIYYNGQPTVKKKAAYARSVGGGIMFWEIGQDAADDRSLIKAACDTLGINYN